MTELESYLLDYINKLNKEEEFIPNREDVAPKTQNDEPVQEEKQPKGRIKFSTLKSNGTTQTVYHKQKYSKDEDLKDIKDQKEKEKIQIKELSELTAADYLALGQLIMPQGNKEVKPFTLSDLKKDMDEDQQKQLDDKVAAHFKTYTNINRFKSATTYIIESIGLDKKERDKFTKQIDGILQSKFYPLTQVMFKIGRLQEGLAESCKNKNTPEAKEAANLFANMCRGIQQGFEEKYFKASENRLFDGRVVSDKFKSDYAIETDYRGSDEEINDPDDPAYAYNVDSVTENISASMTNIRENLAKLPKAGVFGNSKEYNNMLDAMKDFDKIDGLTDYLTGFESGFDNSIEGDERITGMKFDNSVITNYKLNQAIKATETYINKKIAERIPSKIKLKNASPEAVKAAERAAMDKIAADPKVANRFFTALDSLKHMRTMKDALLERVAEVREIQSKTVPDPKKNGATIELSPKQIVEENLKRMAKTVGLKVPGKGTSIKELHEPSPKAKKQKNQEKEQEQKIVL